MCCRYAENAFRSAPFAHANDVIVYSSPEGQCFSILDGKPKGLSNRMVGLKDIKCRRNDLPY